MTDLVAELIWIKNLLGELYVYLPNPPLVYYDNLSVVLLAANPILHSKSKYFELDMHFVRDLLTAKAVSINYIPDKVQVANVLTKSIPSEAFLFFRDKLKVRNSFTLSLRENVNDDIEEKASEIV
ncbi:Copia protein [Arachis hypogaea]|nr:Copia protein [Arachis hypogaea]